MANLYDLKKFDLNLLVIFECIYQHLSISKAAETLFITPSAVSQSLQRLRNQLNDPLFVRSGKGITPTTVGMNLHHHLEKNLNQLEKTIKEGANKQVISSQADSLIKISRIWAD
ncbi:LysR family transcriptional regulator, partial [Klebsiella aerogenes]|uniref:LysR family transcriptional regulator n=1 Tax=Klebsiella aerogenes TaxID=548 RepID=UPI002FF66821